MTTQPVAFITGTSTGFGNLAALGLAQSGYRVYATMRDIAGRNAAPRAELEAKGIRVLELDVTSQSSVDAAAATVRNEAGRVDVLVNNAGTAHMGVTEAFTPESVERQFATNLIGPVRINRAFLPLMRAQKSGLIIFISSVVGRFVLPFTGVYAGSKWALEAYAESLSYELKPSAIDVVIVEPGAYATNIFNALIGPDDQERVAAYGDTANLFAKMGEEMGQSAGHPREVAEAVVELANRQAGTRPLRMTVPRESPAAQINAVVEPIQEQIMTAFGLGELLPSRSRALA